MDYRTMQELEHMRERLSRAEAEIRALQRQVLALEAELEDVRNAKDIDRSGYGG